ncbi:small multi-drug export protein [Candidatus Aerophobetes bacterium]|nr:small multi-drug export protein [Candidatus Aerophobetes bacterium]
MDNLISKPEFLTFLIAMLPISELRGALPFALSCGISPGVAYLISVAGNILPVIPLLLFLERLSSFIMRYPRGKRVLKRILDQGRKKKALVERYSFPGLLLLVAIPLPVTGAWTGTIISFLLSLRLKYAFLAICGGVCLAGIIVLLVSLGIISGVKFLTGM